MSVDARIPCLLGMGSVKGIYPDMIRNPAKLIV
jgi:hypothetical protein